ncbi:MAG: YceD family protein [Huintestinicola sp.]
MVINLKQLYEIVGEKQDIDCSISDERLSEINGYSFIGPVSLKGVVRNRAGIVTLEYKLSFVIDADCDRCLSRFERSFEFEYEHVLVRFLNSDNDEYVVTENDKLELDELAVNDMLLQMPTKLLCKEDCKGLCPKCGADLNVSDCGCNA